MRHLLTILLIVILIPACSTISTKEQQEILINNATKTATLYPSDYDLSKCDKFSVIKTGEFKEFYELRVTDAKTLAECAKKQKSLSDFINLLKSEDAPK